LKELRDALGNDYGITATLPSSYWYLQYFDIKGMEQYLDWFNVMSQYLHLVKVVQDDTNTCLRSVRYPWYITKTNFLHMRLALTIITGTWDGANKFTKKVVQAHTNLTEIDLGLDLLWRNGIDSKKVVMGLGFYGRAFTLQDPSCKKPGCPFSGGAKKGKCTGESGILSNSEIQDIISENGLTPTLVKEDAIKYMVWNTDQWVSYDDEETLKMKLDYANKLCLGGTMIWALDLDKPGKDTSVDSLIGSGFQLDPKWGGSKRALLSARSAAVRSNSYALGLFWTACLPMNTPTQRPQGYRAIAYRHGKVFDADLSHLTGEGCHGKSAVSNMYYVYSFD
jgi:chitinase